MTKLLDTHQHLIYRSEADYPWTKGIPQLEEGDFAVEDYRRLSKEKVEGTIFMEAAVSDDKFEHETRFVSGLAKDPDNNIRGIIASIRPETNEGFGSWLEEGSSLGVVGYRRILHVVDDGMSQTDIFRENVRKIGSAGKVFDMCFLSRQLTFAHELATACANTFMVLDHCGVPDIAGNDIEEWKPKMAKLAELDNVACKLSGILAYCPPGKSTYETIRPYVDHVLEVFGPSRVVWGSDWPVVDMANGLSDWLDVTDQILAGLSSDEADLIAKNNAERIYKL